MERDKIHWQSKMIILFGIWLWKNMEYGHSLLCIHGPQWGFKIGTLLKVCWDDVINIQEDGEATAKIDLIILDIEKSIRPTSDLTRDSIERAYWELDINFEDSIYMNYKTKKPLTSSTLNRELQRLGDKFLKEIKENTGIEFNYKPLKTNGFEIAWALDMVKKYNYSKQVFSAVSDYMGHRTIKDTIKLLEVEPIETIRMDFEILKGLPSSLDLDMFKSNDELSDYILREILYEGEDFIPIIIK